MGSSTSASRSPARRPSASRRSRNTATPAARTSCSSSGAMSGTTRSASSGRRCCHTSDRDEAVIDRERLVADALAAVSIPSFTGSEEAMAAWYGERCEELGLAVQWQQVEEGRANVLGTRAGTGDGPTPMFNGHTGTSYSGREPWLAGIPGFQPEGFERDGRIYGLGISNMKGALAAYLAAVRALTDAPLAGDVMIAAVAGEIEKTQQGDAQGAEYRGYAAGSRHLVGHGGAADMCILGEPTENKLVLAHFGTLWLRLSTSGPFVHTAFSARGLDGVEAEVYVTAPGAEVEEGHALVDALAAAHEEVFGSPPERDVTRWFSDASVLSRYGIETLNYGTSSGLPDEELGENLEIEGLVKTADVYARAAQRICG